MLFEVVCNQLLNWQFGPLLMTYLDPKLGHNQRLVLRYQNPEKMI